MVAPSRSRYRKLRERSNVRISACSKLQVWFFLLVGTWVLYVLAMISMAVGVHKLDPRAGNDTGDVSPHQAADAAFRKLNFNPEELMGEKLKHLTDQLDDQTKRSKEQPPKVERQRTTHKSKPKQQNFAVARVKPKEGTVKEKPKMLRPGFKPEPYGHMVAPEVLVTDTTSKKSVETESRKGLPPPHQVLTAYLEPIDQSTWDTKPLPTRTSTSSDLTKQTYPKLDSCSKLPEQWPVDEYPDADPFLPWIHDVFPTEDGKYLQFVVQNKRRCHTGTTDSEEEILEQMAPQVALFQHVALKKLNDTINTPTNTSPRYRLSSHEDADPESIDTRFICRFKPSGDITFSEFNHDYEWVAFRKSQKKMFSEDGRDNKQIQSSQLLFRCPIPDHLVDSVQSGSSVVDDWATLFVDLIPVRTPPRFGPPDKFLVPHYRDSLPEKRRSRYPFDPHKEWGENHILPALEDSGRWENIPICQPSSMTYEPQILEKQPGGPQGEKHHLVSCLWASTGYTTRGNRFAINDGQRRLLEWITFNKILGFDHFYIYDNSAAFTNETSLQPIADLFPEDVTVIKWPSRVCNNNPNNVDSCGERSSQYAAESSCRLRFGPHARWIGQFDIDEYLVPMGNHDSLLPLLDKLEKEDKKIISFASWRSWPRRTHIK
jgi:hypothetical protein